jgi:endonuclease YncB( thermonuclease family)
MKRYLWLVVFLGVGLVYGFAPKTISGKVISVIDGDTVKVLTMQKDLYRIRLADIDAPEKRQAFGKKSKYFLSDMIGSKIIEVKVKSKDRYGRLIGTIYYNDININFEMLKNGYAWVYRKYSRDIIALEYEKMARYKRLGLWSDPHAMEPWKFRKLKRKH